MAFYWLLLIPKTFEANAIIYNDSDLFGKALRVRDRLILSR